MFKYFKSFKHTFNLFGYKMTFSKTAFFFGEAFNHFVIHFLIGLISFEASFFIGLGIEIRDGEQGHQALYKEGFNLFPDFFFRMIGAYAGAFTLLLYNS